MKYLRLFEDKNEEKEITENFASVLYKFVKFFFNDFDIRLKVKNDYDENTIIFYFSEYDQLFLTIYFTPLPMKNSGKQDVLFFSIRIQILYTDIDIYKKDLEFQRYLFELIRPLCFKHEGVYEYDLHKYKLQELISLLTIEEYELRQSANKYNL